MIVVGMDLLAMIFAVVELVAADRLVRIHLAGGGGNVNLFNAFALIFQLGWPESRFDFLAKDYLNQTSGSRRI
jgi:hypothetical protein